MGRLLQFDGSLAQEHDRPVEAVSFQAAAELDTLAGAGAIVKQDKVELLAVAGDQLPGE